MIEVACTCGDLPAHSHVPTHWATVDGVYRAVYDDPWYVRVWVDWKAYARALVRSEAEEKNVTATPIRSEQRAPGPVVPPDGAWLEKPRYPAVPPDGAW